MAAVKSGREEILRALETAGMDAVARDPKQSKDEAVETREESRRCGTKIPVPREEHRGSRHQSFTPQTAGITS
jgi:hypothetical protein